MRVVRLLAIVLVLAVATRAADAQQPSPPEWAASADSLVQVELARHRVPGAQLAVVQDGRVVYAKGYGVADVETGRPVTERTLFHIGSVTKAFTGALVAQLAAEGRLDAHAPISRYVGELTGRRIGMLTAHQLVVQSAGLIDRAQPFGRTDDAAARDLFRTVTDTLQFSDPGQVYSYSNPGFSLAAHVAERAAGVPFATLMERVVLRPLGMLRATYSPMMAMTYDFSLGHLVRPDSAARVQRPMPVNAAEFGTGFLMASASEVARLAIAIMDGGRLDGRQVLAPAAVRAMTTGHIRRPAPPNTWSGYGLTLDSIGGEPVWYKDGGMPGSAGESVYTSLMTMWPARRLAVVILDNGPYHPWSLTHSVARRIAGTTLPPVPLAVVPRPPTDAERRALVGRYQTAGNAIARMIEVNGTLEWRTPRLTATVRMHGADELAIVRPDGTTFPMLILRDAGGRVRYLHGGGRAVVKLD